jgi:glycosyltransferase involved in cell wall biosynthesis
MLLDRDLPFQVLAVGAGPAREELEAMRDRLGLQGRVHFLGRRFDAVEITAASDIFVLTSDYEGLPVAVMEAMTVGTPVVVTAVGELPHIVNEGRTGRLVAPGDTAALTGCLEELIENPDQRASLAKAARQASPRFEIQRATRRIETVYAELASLESH